MDDLMQDAMTHQVVKSPANLSAERWDIHSAEAACRAELPAQARESRRMTSIMIMPMARRSGKGRSLRGRR